MWVWWKEPGIVQWIGIDGLFQHHDTKFSDHCHWQVSTIPDGVSHCNDRVGMDCLLNQTGYADSSEAIHCGSIMI
jgi:hypothetical protein